MEFMQVFNAIERAGLSAIAYSGRSMYGRECVSFVGRTRDLLRVAYEAARSYDEVLPEPKTDQMGFDDVYYWPKLEWEE